MSHRALVFNVPKGNEVHYSKIQGKILGKVRAPLYHSYSYYVPANKFPPRMHNAAHIMLEEQYKIVRNTAILLVPLSLLFGWTSFWRCALGGVVWSEAESMFATWDGHVTFGSSHIVGHASGFFVYSAVRRLLTQKTSWFMRIALVMIGLIPVDVILEFVGGWVNSGYRPVGDWNDVHRTDHVAHVGGILTGFLNAHFIDQKKQWF